MGSGSPASLDDEVPSVSVSSSLSSEEEDCAVSSTPFAGDVLVSALEVVSEVTTSSSVQPVTPPMLSAKAPKSTEINCFECVD